MAFSFRHSLLEFGLYKIQFMPRSNTAMSSQLTDTCQLHNLYLSASPTRSNLPEAQSAASHGHMEQSPRRRRGSREAIAEPYDRRVEAFRYRLRDRQALQGDHRRRGLQASRSHQALGRRLGSVVPRATTSAGGDSTPRSERFGSLWNHRGVERLR